MASGLRVQLLPATITVGNKLKRACWRVVEVLLFRPSPIIFFRFRVALLRLFGAKVSWQARVYPSCRVWAPWNLSMDAGSCLASDVVMYNVANVNLKEGATVSQGAHICSASHDYRSKGHELIIAPIVIGANAWVAADAFIGPGVTIGQDSVIFARAVVTRNVRENVVIAPAESVEIGYRWPE